VDHSKYARFRQQYDTGLGSDTADIGVVSGDLKNFVMAIFLKITSFLH
jgi:hypothetical protein